MKTLISSIYKGLASTAVLWLVVSCSSDNELGQSYTNEPDKQPDLTNPLGVFEDDNADLIVPEGTNLRINYLEPDYESIASPEYILSQWDGMKECLQVDVPDGYILIEHTVLPTINATDVIQLNDQSFAAVATDLEDDVYFQIMIDDFDPQYDDRGYFFRRIIGPYMWRYNGLSERNYDPGCAAFIVK